MTSLRSGLELGLLSVYWNLSDEGHIEVKAWLQAKQDTPRMRDVWKKLSCHENFQFVSERYALKDRLLGLGFLHDWVHSKGHKHSNKFGILTGNFQTFEEQAFIRWLNAYDEVVKVLSICHLTKYPLGIVKYDWSEKFGA